MKTVTIREGKQRLLERGCVYGEEDVPCATCPEHINAAGSVSTNVSLSLENFIVKGLAKKLCHSDNENHASLVVYL